MRRGSRIGVAIHLQASVEHVIIRGAGVLPGHLVVVEAGPPAAGLPYVAADAEHLVEREPPANAGLPQVAAQGVCERRHDGRAVAAVHVNAVPDPAAEPLEERGAVEVARAVMRAAATRAVVRDEARAERVNALG